MDAYPFGPPVDPGSRLARCREERDACRAAETRLLDRLGELRAAGSVDSSAPTRLPDWTVGHLLTHLARNADSHVHMAEGLSGGETPAQYPGGVAQRTADIEAGAGRPFAALVDDLAAAVDRVATAWDGVPDAVWLSGSVEPIRLGPMPASELPMSRWREVEIHTVDLGLWPLSWDDLPADYVAADLPRLLARVAGRLSPAEAAAAVAALAGRTGPGPVLPPVM